MTAWRAMAPGFLAAVLITLLRLLVIDIDPPVRDITDYLSKDEGFYAFPAYDLFERGQAFNEHPFRLTGIPTITNAGVYSGLVLFGDSYLGLRAGSVLLALIALFCFQAMLRRITQDGLLLNALPLVMVSDLSFGFASIMVEPTIARMAMMLVTMLWLVRVLEMGMSPRALFLHGAGSAAVLLLTYPTNAFVLAACSLAIVLTHAQVTGFGMRSVLRAGVHVLGCILGAGLLLLVTTLIEHNELAYAGTMQESYAHRLSLTLSGMVRNAALLAQGNVFRLSPALGLLFILCSGALFLRRLPQWSHSTVVAVSFLALLLAQCFFINDYPARKLVILLPLVLLTIGAGYTHAASWKPVHKKNLRAMALLLAALAVIAWQVIAQWRSAQVGSTMVLPTLLPGIGVALVASLIVIYVVKDPARWWWSRWLVLLLVLPGSISSLRYMVMDPSHRYRDTLRSLSDYGSAHFIGGASLGFRTYNQIEPRLDPYLLPGGYNAHWPMLARLAQQDSTTNYSIGYMADAAAYRSIGFKVDRILLMDPYETWPERQFVVFKEAR